MTTQKSRNTRRFALKCGASALYMRNMTPATASIEITPVESQALLFAGPAEAGKAAQALGALFGSFAWQVVPVLVLQ